VLTFLQLLWAVAHGLESLSKRMRTTVGVTGPQRLVIRLIARLGKAASSELAEILHVHPSSLTGVLRRLERGGLIRRRPDPEDRRRAILTLTSRGERLSDLALGTVESSVERTLRGVSPEQLAVVHQVLGSLARELGSEQTVSPRLRRASVSKQKPRRRARARDG
jgi:DNA-binding MarR family transcriptional regulator